MRQLSDRDAKAAEDLIYMIHNSLHRWGRVDKVFIDSFLKSMSAKIRSTEEHIDYPTMRESRDPCKDWDALLRDIVSDPIYINLMVIASMDQMLKGMRELCAEMHSVGRQLQDLSLDVHGG